MTGTDYKALVAESRRFVIMDRDSREGVVMLVKRLADAVEALLAENDRLRVMWDRSGKNDLIAERDALQAQLDSMTTAWGVGFGGVRVARFPSEGEAREYLGRTPGHVLVQRLVGPWVEVEGDNTNE